MCFAVVNLYIFALSKSVLPKIDFYFEEKGQHGFVAYFQPCIPVEIM